MSKFRSVRVVTLLSSHTACLLPQKSLRQRPVLTALVLVVATLAWLAGLSFVPPTANAFHPPGSGSCDTFTTGVYALNDTETVKGNANGTVPYGPFDDPPIGSGTARVHVGVRIGAASDPLSGCANPRSLPASFMTDGPGSSRPAYSISGIGTDADKIRLTPPGTTVDSTGTTLTYIGSTWENGLGGAVFLDPSKNFPTSSQVNRNRTSRTIFHYVNCSDPTVGATSYCPPPPPAISCGPVTVTPTSPEPGQAFRSTVNIRNTAPGSTYSGGTASMNIPGVTSGGSYSGPVPTISGGSSENVPSPLNITAAAGRYTVTWTISDGGVPPINCSRSFDVVAKPYFRVYGGDVLAGAPAFGGCPGLTSNKNIIGWNKGTAATGFAGAGSQLAAFAMRTIDGFASAGGRASPGPAKGLSFANTGSAPYGGNFGGQFCTTDYFAEPLSPPLSGNRTLSTMPPLTAGGATNYYVDGNVRITGPLTYPGGSWSLGTVPSFRLIVSGNIYIAPGVTQLDGLYIAQGTIYTCANGFNPMPANGTFHGNCGAKLTVNGAFIANRVKLMRTTGTLLQSISGEGSTAGYIAEVFNFSPELYLTPPSTPDLEAPDYDAITSLPPVL